MHHLIGRDVIQHEAHGFGGIKAIWNGSEFTLRQADMLGVAPVNWQSRNHPTGHCLRHFVSGLFDNTYDVPPRRKWKKRFLRMNALPHQQVCEGHAGSEHAYPHIALPRLRRLYLQGLQDLWSAETANNDTERLHDGPFR